MNLVGKALLDLAASARHEMLLVAPFIKRATLERILSVISPDVQVTCVTRWDPQEIIAGVSDLEVWDLIQNRAGASLKIRIRLHAKFYRADNQCLAGSANITNAALGWGPRPNLELLLAIDAGTSEVAQFEHELMTSSVIADRAVYESTKRAVDALRIAGVSAISLRTPGEEVTPSSEGNTEARTWLPSCRSPDRLYDAYQGREDRMLTSAYEDAQRDLAVLNPPLGVDRRAFNAYIAAILEQLPIIHSIDSFVGTPRRKEEITSFLIKSIGEESDQNLGIEAWDTLKLWLLNFFPERYRIKPPEGEEVFVRGKRYA